MTAQTEVRALPQIRIASRVKLLSVLFVAIMGLGLITLTGHVQAAALHEAAHDVRHATGFPCH